MKVFLLDDKVEFGIIYENDSPLFVDHYYLVIDETGEIYLAYSNYNYLDRNKFIVSSNHPNWENNLLGTGSFQIEDYQN